MSEKFHSKSFLEKEGGELTVEEATTEEEKEKLRNFLEKIAEELKKEGIPLTDECRINVRAFNREASDKGLYSSSTIERDLDDIKRIQEEWLEGLSEEEIKEEKFKKERGEQLEMLKTAVFHKFLREEFNVVRASLHDDIHGKIDNVILERRTGNLVCAFDEVGMIRGKEFEKKKEEVLKRNKGEISGQSYPGGDLKYGIGLKENKLVLKEVKGLPLFYLALPKEYLKKGIKELIPSLEEKSEYEQKLFDFFISLINSQIKSLKLEPHLNPVLKGRIDQFERSLRKFSL